MKLETFFEKFDQFADAPNAVAKMREMVLELAVTGKLVAHEKRDEPASSLLKSAEAERAKLVAAKKIKSRPTSPVEDDEKSYELPSGWAWARLSDVGYELGQKVPDKRFTYIDVGGIDSDKGRISDRVEKLEPGDAPSRARKLVARGTVLYSTVRPYLLNIAIVDQDFDPEPIVSTAFGILHPFAGINNRYLFYWLRSAPFTAYVQAGMKGMAYPAINDEKFYSGPIALPPLAEQKRIVAKVDELMALCDRLEAQQQERETRHAALARASLARFADAPNPANLRFLFHPSYAIPLADLRKSILTLAVQGNLVPPDPNDEPAEVLRPRVDAEREQLVKSKKIRRQDYLGPVADDAIPFDIPASWQWRYLADVCFLITDGAHHTPQYLESGVPFLSVKDVSGGSIDFSSTRYISEEAHRELCKRCPPELGDILLTKVGTTGIAVTVDEDREFSIFVSLALLKFSQPNLDGRYLKHLINSPFVKQQSADNTQGIGNKNLVLRLINRFTVPIPPLAEQRRIVAKVEQLMALVDALEQQLAASRATAANLLSALVAELTTS